MRDLEHLRELGAAEPLPVHDFECDLQVQRDPAQGFEHGTLVTTARQIRVGSRGEIGDGL